MMANSKVKISHGNAVNKINLFNQLPAHKAKKNLPPQE